MRRILRWWRIAVEVQYIVQILEGGLDDEVVPDILRGSQRVKFLDFATKSLVRLFSPKALEPKCARVFRSVSDC